MYGNTREIATRIGRGLEPEYEVDVVPVDGATATLVVVADLVVVGGPTHVHGMTSEKSRAAAVAAAAKDTTLEVDEFAAGMGLRDWFKQVKGHGPAAAFDTRIDASVAVTGRAAKGIARRLRRRGFDEIVPAESFLVDKHNHLLEGEADRAEVWGRTLATRMALR
jgi:flavorubredoxin